MLNTSSLPVSQWWFQYNRKTVPPIWRDIENNKDLKKRFKYLHRSHRRVICDYIGGWNQSSGTRFHHQLKVRVTGRMNAWSQVNIKPECLGMANHAEFCHWRRDLSALTELINREGWENVCQKQSYQKRQAKRCADEAQINWQQASILQWINGDRTRAKRDWHKYAARLAALNIQGEKLQLLSTYYASQIHSPRGWF